MFSSRTKKLFLAFLVLISLSVVSGFVSAAEIHGNIYDLDLELVRNTVMEIDTSPTQRFLVKEGEYNISLEPGTYKILAYSDNGLEKISTAETLVVKDDGKYTFDLFLFPDFEEEEELITDTEISLDSAYYEKEPEGQWFFISAVLVLVSVFLFIWYLSEANKKESESSSQETTPPEQAPVEKITSHSIDKDVEKEHSTDIKNIITLLKDNDGRMTQKDIRKNFPLSEAKVSLMISELEAKGKVRRIKKGRGNIIILQR